MHPVVLALTLQGSPLQLRGPPSRSPPPQCTQSRHTSVPPLQHQTLAAAGMQLPSRPAGEWATQDFLGSQVCQKAPALLCTLLHLQAAAAGVCCHSAVLSVSVTTVPQPATIQNRKPRTTPTTRHACNRCSDHPATITTPCRHSHNKMTCPLCNMGCCRHGVADIAASIWQ